MLIWTEGYRPFIMGGDVNAPLGVEVEAGEPIDVGHGVHVHEIKFSDGRTAIAEATTGAIVGTELQTVRDDVAAADPDFMRQQVQEAGQRVPRVQRLPESEFLQVWKAGRGGQASA